MNEQPAHEHTGQRRLSRWALRENLWGYFFISPFLLGLAIWLLYPVGFSVYISLQRWDLLSPARYVGSANFIRLGRDPLFWQSLKVTAIFTLVRVPGGLVVGFAIALLMNVKIRGISMFRTIYYLPSIGPSEVAFKIG